MTLEQFFVKLGETSGPWVLARFGGIRRTTEADYCCPITALDPARPGPGHWQPCAMGMGLTMGDAALIMNAADNCSGHDPALRARLLAATVERP